MASLPSQASWRRSSSQRASSEPLEGSATESVQSTSSQSFPLNILHESGSADSSAQEAPPMPRSSPSTIEIRTCWICQQDSTDDVPGQEWRSPCPCSLTAHDECLLEWITSEEAPKAGDIQTSHAIKCPQCQAPINIQRPRDIVVQAAGLIQSLARMFIIPTAASAIVGCFYSGFLVYGINTLHVVMGSHEAARILASNSRNVQFWNDTRISVITKLVPAMLKNLDPFFPALQSQFNVELWLGLPMIAPTLVLLRTNIADRFFSIIPVTYFLFRPITRSTFLHSWPPAPGLTFAVLPYIRSLYNEFYRHTFADLERGWDAAVQRKPREGETAEQVAQEQNRIDDAALFNLELEIRNGLGDEDGQMVMINDEGVEEGNVAVGENQAQQQGGVIAAPVPPQRQQRLNRNIPTGSMLSTAMGALFFPAISSAIGEVLKHTLPRRWVDHRFSYQKYLLQEKWGRTVIGGCLFVVLKDAIVLYCKWKKARDFGKKKILDYRGTRGGDAASRSVHTHA